MILLIDNYDSFSYNLYQLIGQINSDLKVIRNDEMTVEDIAKLNPEKIIISPGPGRPEDAGIIMSLPKTLDRTIPLLGVCLGHQARCAAFGAKVTYAPKLMHGKQSLVELDNTCPLFHHLPERTLVARYHSLCVQEDTLPDDLVVTAKTENNEVMAVAHRHYPIYGVQFHPESIMTPDGQQMIANFLAL